MTHAAGPVGHPFTGTAGHLHARHRAMVTVMHEVVLDTLLKQSLCASELDTAHALMLDEAIDRGDENAEAAPKRRTPSPSKRDSLRAPEQAVGTSKTQDGSCGTSTATSRRCTTVARCGWHSAGREVRYERVELRAVRRARGRPALSLGTMKAARILRHFYPGELSPRGLARILGQEPSRVRELLDAIDLDAELVETVVVAVDKREAGIVETARMLLANYNEGLDERDRLSDRLGSQGSASRSQRDSDYPSGASGEGNEPVREAE